MKKNLKILFIGLLSMGLLTGCKNDNVIEPGDDVDNNDEIKVNTNEEVIKDQEIEGFKFENTSIIYEDETTMFETVVTNTSDKTQYLNEFHILVEKDGELITTLVGFIGDSLDAGQSQTIVSYSGLDLTDATSITYQVIR